MNKKTISPTSLIFLMYFLVIFVLSSCESQHQKNSPEKKALLELQQYDLQANRTENSNYKKDKHIDSPNQIVVVPKLKLIPSLKIADTCKNSKAILYEIQKFVNQKDTLNYNKMLYLFTQNEKGQPDCYFSDEEVELSIIYRFIDELLIRSKQDKNIVQFIINLDNALITNVEISEYLTFDILPQIALANTQFFLEGLLLVDEEARKHTIADLVFQTKEKQQQFLKQVNLYRKDVRFQGITKLLNKHFD